MENKPLIIVESPTKARTISKFIGKGYVIKASNGHIRDLPSNASEIPAKYKQEKWSRLGINIEDNFTALYVIPKEKKEHVKDLKEELSNASLLYLATDEDREGESISWHLVEALNPKIPYKRLVFHEITKEAIEAALANPRSIDEDLVKAQETRRIIDRLYGYEVSELLWKKISKGLSAGRVQSVTVRLLVDRERARMAFKKAGYWSLKAVFNKIGADVASGSMEADLTHVDGNRVAIGKDFDPSTGLLAASSKAIVLSEDEAVKLKEDVQKSIPIVSSVEQKPFTSKPFPPFVTSSLQQEANRKLRLPAKRTMIIAQQLYENGYITYMRTDSTTLSEQALNAARSLIKVEYGDAYLPNAPRVYVTKVKNAQEAHEAIRPAGDTFTPMNVVREKLGDEAAKLYELIWKRTMASQMTDAKGTHIGVTIDCQRARFRASGKTIEFPGYLRAYVEGSDDPEAELADQERILPQVTENENLKASQVDTMERSTQPPARFTEGSLIKELETLGIGRPSTWASVVDLVLSRSYAFRKGTALVPSFTGFAVVQLLERHFNELVDYDFTARLEDELDAISRGEVPNIDYLRKFYFGDDNQGLKSLVTRGETEIDPREVCGVPIGTTETGENIEVRIGRYGPFISNGTSHAPLRDLVVPDEFTVAEAVEQLAKVQKGPEELGIELKSGLPVYLKDGPYGPYVQLGEREEKKKPKAVSLLKGMLPQDVTLELALKLLELPRCLGEHPETGKNVFARTGRFGPYIECGTDTRRIPDDEGYSVLDISFEQALLLLSQPKTKGKAAGPKVLRSLGNHPVSNLEITIRTGRYGPYVTDGETNASVQKGMDPDTLSLDDAVNLIEDRKARPVVEKPKRGRKKK